MDRKELRRPLQKANEASESTSTDVAVNFRVEV
jgi:hypothetical protein